VVHPQRPVIRIDHEGSPCSYDDRWRSRSEVYEDDPQRASREGFASGGSPCRRRVRRCRALVRCKQGGLPADWTNAEELKLQIRSGEGFSQQDFDVDYQIETAVCPAGKTAASWREHEDERRGRYVKVRFSRTDCLPCELKAKCMKAKSRSLLLHVEEYDRALRKARALMKGPSTDKLGGRAAPLPAARRRRGGYLTGREGDGPPTVQVSGVGKDTCVTSAAALNLTESARGSSSTAPNQPGRRASPGWPLITQMIRQQGHFVFETGTYVRIPPTDISTAQDVHSPSLKGMFSKGRSSRIVVASTC
jgi:hypothetical protein